MIHLRSCIILIAISLFSVAALAQNNNSQPNDESNASNNETREANPRLAPLEVKASWGRGQIRKALGVAAAQRRLGRELPTGQGIVIGQVESGKGYIPNPDYKPFHEILFHRHSGHSQPSQHAQSVGACIYGPNGIAPGIQEVHLFSTPNWLTKGYLGAGTENPPEQTPIRLFNHSWISTDPQGAPEVLRRVDYAIDTHGVIMCVGVNNNRNSAVPPLLAQAYNAIAVGSAKSPGSSGGRTTIEGEGRCKPDVVGPFHRTSFTTAMVTAVVACLMDAAHNIDDESLQQQALKPQTMKALLMTGALKPANWSATPEHPLDEHLGAGVVNLNRSLLILEQNDDAENDESVAAGWAFGSLPPQQTAQGGFELSEPAETFTATLVWHRKIASAVMNIESEERNIWVGMPLTTQFQLKLWRVNQDEEAEEIAASISAVDNVQHIYVPDGLPAGQYILDIARGPSQLPIPWEFSIAWLVDLK